MSAYGSKENPLTMADAMNWPLIRPGHILHIRGGVKRGDFVCKLAGTHEAPIKIEFDDAAIDGSMTINGQDTTWIDPEIYKSDWKRQTDITGSDPADIDGGGLIINGPRVKLDGAHIHDVETVGWWSSAIDSEIVNSKIYYVGWLGPDRGHGHAVYSNNDIGVKRLRNVILHDCFGLGLHVYGSSRSKLNNYALSGVIAFKAGSLADAPTGDILIGGELGAECQNITVERSFTYGGNYGLQIGYVGGAENVAVKDGRYPNGRAYNNITGLTDTGNVYDTVGDAVYCWASDRPGHGTIIAYNQAQAKSFRGDVSPVLRPGAGYRLRNAQDYNGDIVDGVVSLDGTISVDMRAESHTVAKPVNWPAPKTTFPEFGAFLLEAI